MDAGAKERARSNRVRLALLGDVMLGRGVDAYASSSEPGFVWGDALPILADADLRIVNLECVIADAEAGRAWPGKTFHFKAGPWAIAALKRARVDAVALANNHVLDFQADAFLQMLKRLEAAGIAFTGAGRSLASASAPVFLQATDVRVGLLAVTDNEPGWEARALISEDPAQSAGVFYVPLTTEGPRFGQLAAAIEEARSGSEVVIVSAHVGPHMREAPDESYAAFARAIIDAGANVYMGSSNHIFQGVERYGEGLILYDLGDAVDDYAVDQSLRNDRSFVFLAEFDGGRFRSLALHPTEIVQNQIRRAGEPAREWSLSRMQKLSGELGTQLTRQEDVLVLER